MSQGGPPATLWWQGTTSGDACLRLLTHGWSGVAQVRWNGGGARTLDLYSATAVDAVVPLPYGSDAAQPNAASQIAALMATAISLAALIYIVGGIALAASRRRPRLTPRPQPGDESTR